MLIAQLMVTIGSKVPQNGGDEKELFHDWEPIRPNLRSNCLRMPNDQFDLALRGFFRSAQSDLKHKLPTKYYLLHIALILDLDLGLAMFIGSFLLYTKINVVTILSPIFVKLWSKYLANFIL